MVALELQLRWVKTILMFLQCVYLVLCIYLHDLYVCAACVYGDPHIVTLDGYKYTFNGKGEFTLIETADNSFTLQARMVEADDANGTSVSATVFSAVVGRQIDSDTVQFEVINGSLIALVNGETVSFDDLEEQDFNNVIINRLDTGALSASFSSGTYIEVREENDIISVLLVGLPRDFQNIQTFGLMGSFNGNTADDLLPRQSIDPLPLDSSLQEIHEQFGITCESNYNFYKVCRCTVP